MGQPYMPGKQKRRVMPGRFLSIAAVLLWDVVRGRYKDNPGLLAHEIDTTSVNTLTHWMYGDRRPDPETSVKLQTHIGLAYEGWLRPAPSHWHLPVFDARMRAGAQELLDRGARGTTAADLARVCDVTPVQADKIVEALVADGFARVEGDRVFVVPYDEDEEARRRESMRRAIESEAAEVATAAAARMPANW